MDDTQPYICNATDRRDWGACSEDVSTSEAAGALDGVELESHEREPVIQVDEAYCCCRKAPEGKMIRCDNWGRCPYGWVHQKCLAMTDAECEEIRTMGQWFCPECRGGGRLKRWAKKRRREVERAERIDRRELWEAAVVSVKGMSCE